MFDYIPVSNSDEQKEYLQISDEIGLILNEEGIDDFSKKDISKYLSNLEKIQEELKKEYRIILDENKDIKYSVKQMELENTEITRYEVFIRNFINKIKTYYLKDSKIIIEEYSEFMNIFYNIDRFSEYMEIVNNKEIKDELNKLFVFYFEFFLNKLNYLIFLIYYNELLDYPYIEDVSVDGIKINIGKEIEEIAGRFNV